MIVVCALFTPLALFFLIGLLSPSFGIIYLLPFIALAIISLIGSIVVMYLGMSTLFAEIVNDENAGLHEIFRRGWKKILPSLWLSFIFCWIIFGSFFLFIVPALIFCIWFSLCFWVLYSENTGGLKALILSREYIRGHFFGVLWRFIFIELIYILASIAIEVLPTSINLFFDSFFFETLANYIRTFSELVLIALITPLIWIYHFVIYRNLKKSVTEINAVPTTRLKILYLGLPLLGIVVATILFITVAKPFLSNLVSTRVQHEQMDEKTVEDIRVTQFGLEIFRSDEDRYPETLEELFSNPNVQRKDSIPTQYRYRSLEHGQSYELCSTLLTYKDLCVDPSSAKSAIDEIAENLTFPNVPSGQ